MDIWLIVAGTAVVLTSIQMLPQVVKSLRTRAVRDLSLWMIVIIACGATSWLAYGIHIQDWAIMTANALNLLFALVLLKLKLSE
jgi:MtN3 and saliva related transmembrane protein